MFNAWVLNHLLADLPLNGELDMMSPPWKGIAEQLVNVDAALRTTVLNALLGITPGGPEMLQSVINTDPMAPCPVVQPAAKRRAARLADLTTASGSSRFVWPNWIVRAHFTLLSSNPKVGKTRFALEVAKRIYTASLWPDGQPATFPAGTPTLWVCGDRHQEELRDLATEYGLPHDAICLNALPAEPYGGWDLDNPDNVELLAELIENEKPGLAFIDTVWRATRKKLCREDEVNKFIDPIISIAQQTDTSIVGLMHLSKDMDTLGRRLEGSARGVMKIFKPDPGQPNRRRLEVIGNFKETPPLGITMRDSGCDFDLNPPSEPTKNPGGRPPEKLGAAIVFISEKLSVSDMATREIRQGMGG